MRNQDTDAAWRRIFAKPLRFFQWQWSWMVAAAAIVLAVGVVFVSVRSPKRTSKQSNAPVNLALQWPSSAPFDPATLKSWGPSSSPLGKGLPDFSKGTATLGAGGDDRVVQWRLATVIVRSNDGWGSGAFISPDGWLLTNYHVVASTAQKAAVTGGPVILDVITARMVEGRMKPQPALKATVYRVDPVHDLALLKLQVLPGGIAQMPYFKLAREIQDGENCFVIGSQGNGPAWWVRSRSRPAIESCCRRSRALSL